MSKKLSWKHPLRALAAAAALLAGACTESADPPAGLGTAAYRTHDGRVVGYPIAPEAKLRDVAVTTSGARTIIRVATEGPISPSEGGPLTIDVHFSDGREVAFARSFAYPSRDRFEGAAVLDARTGAVLGRVDVVTTAGGAGIDLAFDSSLVTGRPLLAVSRYLPSAEAVAEAAGGLERAEASVLPLDPAMGTKTSAVPFAGGNRVADRGSFTAPAWEFHFGPPPGTSNDNPKTPLITVPGGFGTITVVDLESNYPFAGDYNTGFTACEKPILCGWFTWTDTTSFIGGCGRDENGNGKLDGNEIESWFGYCKFDYAINDTWQDADGYIHWENVGTLIYAGQIYKYVFDPRTGYLEVRYSNDFGQTYSLVYTGPGVGGFGGWDFFPAPGLIANTCPAPGPGPVVP